MDFKIPEKLIVGSIEYKVDLKDSIDKEEDFGWWSCDGTIEIARSVGRVAVSESRKRQTFWHELTHAILHQMGKTDLNDDESFVNTFSSFLSGAVDTMEERHVCDEEKMKDDDDMMVIGREDFECIRSSFRVIRKIAKEKLIGRDCVATSDRALNEISVKAKDAIEFMNVLSEE